jgi:hypothetical protein
VWESISPVQGVEGDTTGKNFAESVVVDPFDPATVWLGTGLAGVFKSTNCGGPGSFSHVNTGANGDQVDKGGISTFQVDPKHPGVLHVNAFMGPLGLWKSTSGGVDWTQLFPADSELAKVVPGAFVNAVAIAERRGRLCPRVRWRAPHSLFRQLARRGVANRDRVT